ncbi:uncharacterized protein B0T23DRAFT_77334 [Neurospora hispaniola]|uniref:Secreted protein n=1 Tax=Neurospora hispaniola TaxID=588809 RepID=A0AAJ0ICK9_9PEZI|nr:hypothetical protein B0T23DRAFT_77334 [Neurospora hispaniola]
MMLLRLWYRMPALLILILDVGKDHSARSGFLSLQPRRMYVPRNNASGGLNNPRIWIDKPSTYRKARSNPQTKSLYLTPRQIRADGANSNRLPS